MADQKNNKQNKQKKKRKNVLIFQLRFGERRHRDRQALHRLLEHKNNTNNNNNNMSISNLPERDNKCVRARRRQR